MRASRLSQVELQEIYERDDKPVDGWKWSTTGEHMTVLYSSGEIIQINPPVRTMRAHIPSAMMDRLTGLLEEEVERRGLTPVMVPIPRPGRNHLRFPVCYYPLDQCRCLAEAHHPQPHSWPA